MEGSKRETRFQVMTATDINCRCEQDQPLPGIDDIAPETQDARGHYPQGPKLFPSTTRLQCHTHAHLSK